MTKDGAFHKMTLEQWNSVINTNLGSLFNMTRQVIEGMRARKFGRVISISSINGQKGQFGQVNYSAAKAGDIGFTKALALENAKAGITVNAICPGYINTEMVQAVPKEVLDKSILPLIPTGRLGEPDQHGLRHRRRGNINIDFVRCCVDANEHVKRDLRKQMRGTAVGPSKASNVSASLAIRGNSKRG